MKKITVFGTILTVPMLALVAGTAMAADPAPSVSDTGATAGDTMKPAASDTQAPETPANAAARTAMPTKAAIGREVVNTKGDTVGEVSAITGDRVIVDVGGFLGMGTHGVALNWRDLTPIGSGEGMTLQTALTKQQIEDLPKAESGAQDTAQTGEASDQMTDSAAQTGMSSQKADMPTKAMIGREVVNAEGDTVGEVSAVAGNRVIVEVGGFLGIGARGVALNWRDLTPIGSGEDMKLETTLTDAQIKDLPKYDQ
ncbi:PRC-barrel domain-containing protein [Roseospira marina]|uniref:PRC-barrel domain-containing protein n=1 Tax=Roseospira marina TaxID=140057 RepID=UPI0014789A74|nr:PRC-barrel domain-containing protein [Roseospira marina]MBB4315902.1 sporulation protein YlmC with PRC-barrel domain [Roseospira marina]MBB5089052.1 sporulation protein YlmC with PRC-barrel domain [Roseospira marina]